MSVKLGARGAYHAEGYDFLAYVIDVDADDAGNPDNNLELRIECPARLVGVAGLDRGANYRFSHVDDKSGGFTPNK